MDKFKSDRIRWMDHKGIKILFTDFRGLKSEEYFPILDEAIQAVKDEKPNSIFTLSAHSEIHITEDLRQKTEEFKKAAEGKSKGTATFGLEGVQKIIARAVKRDVYFAKSMEDALTWIEKKSR